MSNHPKIQIEIKSEKHYYKVVKVLTKMGYKPMMLTHKPCDVALIKASGRSYTDYQSLNRLYPYPQVTLKKLKKMLKENEG